jgi:uncharacterized protein (TIGR02597 family)
MKLPVKLALASLLAAAISTTASATTASTDPVGFVTVIVNANSDQKIGTPMVSAPVFQGSASSVSGVNVEASGLPGIAGSNYLLVTSGSAAGSWEAVNSVSGNNVVLGNTISGFSSGDTFLIRPFWTLGTLLPGGGGIPVSPDVFAPVAFVLVNNPSATGINIAPASLYFYHDGSQGPAGWYDAGDINAGIKNGVILSPEVSLAIRNSSASQISVPLVGSVPMNSLNIDVIASQVAQQDNAIYNQFPAGVTLETSGLAQSGAVGASPDVFSPTDLLLVFSSSSSGINPSPSSIYLYHDGSQGPAGWYDSGDINAGLKNNVELPPGSAFIVRKAAGSSSASWNPNVPYLNN